MHDTDADPCTDADAEPDADAGASDDGAPDHDPRALGAPDASGAPANVQVTIHVVMHPTEDEGKLRTAITNLFPDASITVSDRHLRGESASVEHFKHLVRKQRIRNSTRAQLAGSKICPGPAARGQGPDRPMEHTAAAAAAPIPPPVVGRPKAVSTAMYLNKNAAYMGYVNFSVGSAPLGSMQVKISAPSPAELDAVIEYMTAADDA